MQFLVDFREQEKKDVCSNLKWQFLVVVFLDTVCLNSVKERENKQIKMQSREQPNCIVYADKYLLFNKPYTFTVSEFYKKLFEQ